MVTKRKRGRGFQVLAGVTVLVLLLLGVGARWFRAPDGTPSGPLGPLSAFALPGGERMRFEGHVVERLEAGSYTYLQVEKAGGARSWVVTLTSSRGARARADDVRIVAMGFADHFDSKRLGRSFDGLYFAVVTPL